MSQPRAYCEVQCPTCPLRELTASDKATREYVARNIANVFARFGRSQIIEAYRQGRFVYDGSSIDQVRWQAQLLADEDSMPLDLDDEKRVNEAILKIANGECDNYFAERR